MEEASAIYPTFITLSSARGIFDAALRPPSLNGKALAKLTDKLVPIGFVLLYPSSVTASPCHLPLMGRL